MIIHFHLIQKLIFANLSSERFTSEWLLCGILTAHCHGQKLPIYFKYTAAIDSMTLNTVKTYVDAFLLLKTNTKSID